ncbi:MAG: SDR family NAD(P)-dependent oxidoreductase [Myxococcota bacterium]|nr:SDR family NAD(P)-dependent oxidoreductase [Myxococcota bacterium]
MSGGSRGIGSEAALALGESLGLRLVLLGRSAPDTSQVTSTLKAARLRGIDARYLSVDVCDYESLANALASLKAPFDRIDGLLHAAGVNTPAHFDSIDDEALQACLAPKLLGLENLLRASEDRGCRLAVGFGSMISTLGLAGESHYALANGEMSARLERWARETGRLSLTLDWSVWAGAGMGERLGAVERLAAQGVQAIPLEHALERLVKLFSTLDCGGRFMVTGRFADHNDTLFEPRVLHDGRFVSSRRLLYPGVEAIFDARIAPGSDPWLDDHVVDGVRVVPGVMLLEAMAQAAITVTDAPLSGFSDVAFLQAICPDDHGVDLRIAVLRRDDGTVSATVRASDDGFAADRCAATLVTGKKAKMDDLVVQRQGEEPLDGWAIYPALCFAKGRFRRIDSIEALSAFALHAKISAPDKRPWFGPFESSILQLGDPGARDAGRHVLKACVPQTLVLAVSVREIQIADTSTPRRSVEALEISSDGTEFEFDILYRGAEGQALEYWRGARFRATGQRCIADLPAALLATALERSAATIAGRRNVRIASAGTRGDCDRRRMVLSTLGIECSWKRGDGAAEILGKDAVSLSHSASLTLGIRGKPPVACDVVDPGAEADRALAPEDARLLSGFGSAAGAGASALVWAARECARKGAQPAGQPLVRLNPGVDDQPIFRCGTALIICNRFAETGAAAILLNSGDIQDQEVRA